MLNRSLYLFVAKMAGYAVRLVLPYFLVRLLTVGDFGAYRQFFLLEVYIATLFQFGVNQALFYFIPRDTRNAGAYLLNSLLLNMLILSAAFLGIGLARDQLSAWLNMAILVDAFWLLAIHTLALMLISACDAFLTARQAVRSAAAFDFGGQVLVSAVTVWLAFATRRLDAVLVGLVVGRAVQLVAMVAFVHWRLQGFRAQRYFFGVVEQVRYGVVLGVAGTLWSMISRLHDFFVSRYFGTEVYAVYSAGCTEIPVTQVFTQAVAMVTLGQFALLEQQKDWEGIRKLWHRVLTSSYAITIPSVILLLAVSKPLVLFMFTSTYADAVPIFQINTLLKLHLIFNATLVLRAMNRNDVSIWVNLATLLVAPAALYAGMRYGGLLGIIAAQAVLMIASRFAATVIMNRISDVRLPYTVGVGDILAMYREAWQKLREIAASGQRRHAAVSASGRDKP